MFEYLQAWQGELNWTYGMRDVVDPLVEYCRQNRGIYVKRHGRVKEHKGYEVKIKDFLRASVKWPPASTLYNKKHELFVRIEHQGL